MNGYKTYAAGIGTALLGLAQCVLAFAKPEAGISLDQGIQTLFAGLAIVGIGHKLDKAS